MRSALIRDNRSRTSRQSNRRAAGSRLRRGSSSDGSDWESLSEHESSIDDAPSDLAYGPSAPRAAPPQPLPPMSTALASTASRWSGSRESGSVVDPRLFGPVNSLRGLVTPRPSDNESAEANAQYKNFNRLRRVETDAVPVTAPVAPLKHMFPVPTSDPSKFEADAASSVSSRQDSCLVARQDHQPILRHPAPKTPVSSQVFKTDPLQRAPSKPADFDGAFGQAAIGAIAGAAWDYSRRDGGEALEECSHQGRDSRREQRREERRREERRDEQQHERRDEDELREQRRQERREERREQRRDERRDDKKQNESDHSGPRSSRNLGDDERRHHDRRSEKSDKHEKDPKQSQRELDRDRGRRKAKRDSYSSKNTDNASHKPSSHRGDESIISRSSHATAGFRDDQVGKSYSRQGIQVEVDPQEFDESASRSARKESRRSKDRHEHRETRENENDKPFGANDSSQPISQSAAIDPFQYLIHDDVSYSRQAATASEEKPMATGALNRQADSSHCRQAEPAATFATDEALSQWRVHDQDTHGDLREHRGPLHNHVQQDANRYYRQAAKARKINQEGYNSSHGAAKTSVVDADKWHSENNDRPRIVTPPEVEYRQHDISSNPYGAPDADVRLDNKMFPQDAHTFKARSHGLGAPDLSRRDPCCERDRPMLNLVFPTPEASRRATPSPEQLRGNAKEDDTRQQDQGDCWSRHHDVYDYASAATEPGDDTALPPSTPKSVSWGENSTKRFEVESPEHKSDAENSRDRVRPRLDTSSQWGILAQAISGSSPEPDNEPRVMDTGRVLGEPLADRGEAHSADSRASEPANDPKYISPEHGKMPGGFTDDIAFAATLAAGLQDTGFDPNLVLNDPHYHRRDSPPGEGEAKGDGWDQQSCTDAAAASTAWDSPRHKPLPESRQESVVDDTDMPAGEPSEKPYAAGSVPEPPLQLSKKERRKLEKAKRQLANSSTTATADSSEVASIVDGSETQRELSKEEQRQLDREAILGDSVRNDGHGWRGGDEKKSEKRSKKSGRSGEGSNRGSGSHESPSVFGAPSEVSVGSSGKRSSKSKRGSGTQDDLDDYGHDPPGQHSRHVFEERDVSSVVSEPRSSEYRRDSKGKKRSTRYEDDDAKSVASAPGSSRKGKDAEKRSSGLFSGIFKSGGSKEEHKKESFLANADIFGADVGTAVSAPLESSSGSPKATQSSLSYPASDYEHEHNFHKHGNYKRRDSDVVARAVKPSIDPQYGDLLLLPPSKPGSPQDFPTDLPSLPESGPSTPVEERHNMMLAHRRHRSAQETPPKTPSTTAIPISWRRSQRNTPTRPGFDLKSPLKSPLTSPIGGHESAARRPARHASWDRNREIQPLFLVEHARHYSADAFAHAASLSELPPSEPSSRASSVPAEQHETAMDTIASHADDEPRGLQIDTDLAAAALPEDVAGSQETTPRAGKQMEPETELPALPGSTNGEDDGGYSCASPDPVESMSKDRSSYLLHSSPPSDKSGRYAGGTWEPSSVQGMEATTALADELEHDFTSADEHFSDALEGQHDPMSDSGADDVVERHHLPHGVGETEQVLEEATAEHAKPLTWDVGAEDAEMSTEVTERHSASAVPEVATMEPPIQETVTKTTPRPTVAEGIEILTRDSVSNTAKEFKPVERETFESPVSEVPFSDTEPLKNTITSSLPAATESSSQEGEDEAVYSMATRGPEQLTQDDATEFKGISCPGTLPIGLEPDVDAMTILAAVEADKLAHEAARGEAENSSLPQTSPDKFVPSMNPRLPYPVSPAAQDDPESAHAIADSSRNQVAADTIVSVATEDAEPPEWSNMSANARKKARRARRALGLGIAETVAAAATSSLSPDSLTDQGTTSSQPEPSQEESDKTRKGKKKRNKGKKKSPSPDEDAQQVLVASDAGREVSAAATEVLDARSSITKEHVPEESALTTYPLDQLGGDESTAAVVTDKVPKDSAKIEAGTRNDTVVKDAESQGQTLCSRDGSRDPETFDVPLESAKPAGKTNKDETSPTSKESGNQVQGDDILDMGESKKDDATSANFKKGKKKRKDRKKKEIQNQPLTDESASVQSEVDTTLATASQPDHTAYSLLKDMTNEAKPKTFRKECIETVQEHSVGGNQLSRNTARQEDEDTGPASVSEEILAIPVAINAARDSVQQHIPEAFFDTDPRAAPEQVETIHAITVDDDVSLPREAAEKSPVEAEAAADDIDVTAELPAPEDVSESLADAAVDLIEGSLFKTGRDIRDMTEEPPSHPSEQDICDAPERSESVTVQEEPSREPQEPGTKESLELVSETSNATFPVEQEPQRHESPKVFLSRVINEDVSISSDDKRVVETPRSVFSETANDAESGLKIPQDPSAQTADQSFNHEARQLHGETLEDAQRVFNTGIDATSAERIGASELNETMTDSTQVKRVEIPPDIAIQDVANVVLDTARELPLESATEPELFERLQNADKYCTETLGKPWARSDAIDASSNSQGSAAETAKDVNNDIDHGIAEPLKDKTHDAEFPEIQAVNDPEDRKRSFYPSSPNLHVAASHFDLASETPVYSPSASRLLPATAFALALIPIKPCDLAREGSGASGIVETPEHSAKVQHKDTVQESDKSDDYQALEPTLCPLVVVEQRFAEDAGKSEQDIVGKPTFEFKDQSQNHQYLIENAPKPNFASPDEVQDEVDEIQSQGLDDIEQSDIKKGPVADLDLGQDKVKKEQSDAVVAEPVDKTLADTFHYEPPASFNANLSGENDKSLEHDTDGAIDAKVEKEEEEEEEEEGPLLLHCHWR
ncbi:hypothetical protein CDD82_4557 [Ophiocordyceps australis]|uniref:Involucrin repeat protein n=1 Tax=Ophiocordyceps australis TaxID=1399860 RepID=A0A2C5Z5T2_9HYPO|nr:hypothetical protein CDD82_4557 [Ophiocordyceps australis]